MASKFAKNVRVLDMYVRLCEGKVLSKSEEARRFGVDERSIQRDIDDIRSYLSERAAGELGEPRTVVYDRGKKGFLMQGCGSSMLDNSEILAVCKILLESRAFAKEEISSILDKLISGCVPQKYVKQVADLVSNEKFHYVDLHEQSLIKDKLWELGSHIRQNERLSITYEKKYEKCEMVKRVVEPVAIMFSEYYFYLCAYRVELDEEGRYHHKYNYPTIFRIDRIREFHPTGEKFRVERAERFEDGIFRRRIQFMLAGELMHITFRYTGKNVNAVLDRLPTAEIESQDDSGAYIIRAEVFGKGIVMWLLSQGRNVEVLSPPEFRQEIRDTLADMLGKYEEEI